MRIVFMGAGGIGGDFGARPIAAGVQVGLVARGAPGKAMRERGPGSYSHIRAHEDVPQPTFRLVLGKKK